MNWVTRVSEQGDREEEDREEEEGDTVEGGWGWVTWSGGTNTQHDGWREGKEDKV